MTNREPELPSRARRPRASAATGDRAPGARAPRVPFALLVTAMVLGGMALLLALNTASAANELARHDLAVRDDQISASVQELRDDVAASAAPANLARAAQALGMVPAQDPAFLVIGPDGKVRVLGQAQAVTAAPLPLPAVATHTSRPKAKAKAKAKASTSASTSASKSRSPSRSASRSASKSPSKSPSKSTGTTARPKPVPTPTPTPTPVYTLPGGPR